MKRVAILQSNYIPWKGYFDIIASVDEFIIYDDVQYTKNDWRNRNQIKTSDGVQWLTIPVGSSIQRQIRDVQVQSQSWRKKHWKTLQQNYRRAPAFELIAAWLEPLYHRSEETHLSILNRTFIQAINDYLGITTKLSWSWDYALVDGKTHRLVKLCEQANATTYVTGPAASAYLDIKAFTDSGISVEWFNYSDYPEYPQLWGDFEHKLSILDLLFNCGPRAVKYMKHLHSRHQLRL